MAGQSCSLCEKPIEPGQHVAFQHGELLHLHCYSLERLAKKSGRPVVCCAMCGVPVQPDSDLVFVADDRVVHKQCPQPAGTSARPICGGSDDEPRTIVFDRRVARRARDDRAAVEELRATSRDIISRSYTLCARAHQACARARSACAEHRSLLTRA